MDFNEVDLTLPHGFTNIVRLFPLPNLVLFPGVMQALHVFEQRYRELMHDALAADNLISMALVKEDPLAQLSGASSKPKLHEVICIGKIVTEAKLEDGRYNLLLMGIQRAEIIREIASDKPYRMAEIRLLQPEMLSDPEEAVWREKLIRKFSELAGVRQGFDSQVVSNLTNSEMPFGLLVDLIGYSCGVSPVLQQKVLSTVDLNVRTELVLEFIDQQMKIDESHSNDFPPGFSLN